MRAKRITALSLAVLTIISLVAGCGAKKLDSPLNGKWTYLYNKEDPVADFVVNDDASVKLDKKKYKDCSVDDERIYLKDSKGLSEGIRYKFDGEDKIFLYKQAVYKYQGEGTPNGLIGNWVGVDNPNIFYEFTEEGTFMEEPYTPGYYVADEEAGTIFCVYNDHYEDTIVYYTIKDNLLYIEYPWPMVRYSK